MNLASFIDHTLLKSSCTANEVDKLCKEAIQYNFAAVCIPPVYVVHAVEELKNDPVKIATVIGFPFGYTYIRAKVEEAKQAIDDGADELDMVMNITAFKNYDFIYLEKEVSAVLKITKKHNVLLKIIIESGLLNNDEIISCCKFFKSFDIDFLKTSTGYAEKGATVETVQLMRHNLPSCIKIKASGGIRTTDFAIQLINAGAERLGCSASVAIVVGQAGKDS
ncbi:MAG: deoxyribose-phosphate aldolase [Chitinophagaceae bacterium]